MYRALLIGLLAVVPSSTNFTLESHEFGTGASGSSSSNYNLQVNTGSPAGSLSSSSYGLPAGVQTSTDVAVPPAPTFQNPDSSYNRLKLTLNTNGLPGDAKYLIAISDDNFATVQYVQADQTVGSGAGIANYQSYAAWGGASGSWVLGLDYGTQYKVRVAALQGTKTGSPFGPVATATTAQPSVTFAVSTSLTSSPPFNVLFASLPPGVVTSANATLTAAITTNAQHGGEIVARSQYGGLTSTVAAYTINSATTDLQAANAGYGTQVTSVTQGSGGPLTAASPFDGVADNVGGLTTAWQRLASFPGSISGGTVDVGLKAKTNSTVPSATDYADILTLSILLFF